MLWFCLCRFLKKIHMFLFAEMRSKVNGTTVTTTITLLQSGYPTLWDTLFDLVLCFGFFFFLLHKLISFDNTNFSSSEKSPTFHLTFEFISKLCCFWNSPLLNFWEVILHGYFFVMQKLLFSLEFQGLSKVHLTTLSNSWTFW